nr:MAG TPA: hypothetical protein [Caudoviricetes sp.]
MINKYYHFRPPLSRDFLKKIEKVSKKLKPLLKLTAFQQFTRAFLSELR